MKIHLILLISLISSISTKAQSIADISFSTNGWTAPNGITIAGNEMTITGNSGAYVRSYLDVTVPTSTETVYFVAEIQLISIVPGAFSYQLPKMKIYEGGTTSNIQAYNLSEVPENEFLITGMRIKNFDKLGLSQIRLEFAIQNAEGTMLVKNPQLLSAPPASSVSFPFELPSDPSCYLNIDTSQYHAFENDLLSTNSHFTWASYKWGDIEVSAMIDEFFPMTNMRFPGGTVGNFYNWATDGFHNDVYAQQNSSAVNGYNNGFTFGYQGYKSIALANNASTTLMFNVISDDVATAQNRLQSRIDDGLDIKWIEMGNENFYNGQNYGNVSSLSNYISHTTALAAGLKQIDPNVRVAVNIDHSNYGAGTWNNAIAAESYYDAVVSHLYVSTNTFLLNKLSAYKMMSAYKITRERLAEYNAHFPAIPLLCTEWNVLSDGTPVNFIQTLAIADQFLALERGNHDGIVAQAGIHMLYHSDAYREATLSYYDNASNSMVLTANGIFYASLFKTFQSGKVFDAYSVSEELETDLPAVNAKAIDLGDSIKVFVVNKLPLASPLNLDINGTAYLGNYKLAHFSEDINQTLTTPYATFEAAWTIQTGSGGIDIPPYSISIVTISKADAGLLPSLSLEAKVFLEGPYDSASGLMSDNLRAWGHIPTSEPYASLGFEAATGGEVVDLSVLSNTGSQAVVDWAFVELRDANDATRVLFARAALLLRDGSLVDTDGSSPLHFSNAPAASYYIAIHHRNHLAIMTQNAINLVDNTPNSLDFTTPATTLLGTNPTKNINGTLVLWSGDANPDSAIDAADRSEAWNSRNTTGYLLTDLNLDGACDATDRSTAWNNRNKTAQLP